MRHGYKKNKFANGYDADRMLMRKLALNFFLEGKVETTLSKAQAVKPVIEKMVTKIKAGATSDRNVLTRKFGSLELLKEKMEEISTSLKEVKGGYTKIIKLGFRDSDGAPTARVEWAHPVVGKKVSVQKT